MLQINSETASLTEIPHDGLCGASIPRTFEDYPQKLQQFLTALKATKSVQLTHEGRPYGVLQINYDDASLQSTGLGGNITIERTDEKYPQILEKFLTLQGK